MSAAQTGLWVKKSLQIQFHKYKSTFKPYCKKEYDLTTPLLQPLNTSSCSGSEKQPLPLIMMLYRYCSTRRRKKRFYMVQKMDFLGMGRTHNQPTICYTVYLRLALMIHNSPYELQQSFSYSE